ncbi:hypothetical protein MMYC01_201666 [Madurella mycetomatis]|uniref:Uncharacterized protein n=1 Tax=Madurella mycetomatis TaxID=100816 RepID=A0A175WF89_9PEZI|nr:hypothetical protein MMYC01_202415 [Madurella mycetomatis]KXX82438.1 hypothetical protein MMYC01_201666 [Madurella mycetomatis]
MRFHLLALTATAATLATGNPLQKRCSPVYDPDLALGYQPPAPCWQTFDPACQPHLASGTEMTLDAEHRLAVVYGVSANCQAQIAEELGREADGRKNNGWVQEHGSLTVIPGEDILVISNMPEQTVESYQSLTYLGPPWGTGSE